jgi:hypothetical protein
VSYKALQVNNLQSFTFLSREPKTACDPITGKMAVRMNFLDFETGVLAKL